MKPRAVFVLKELGGHDSEIVLGVLGSTKECRYRLPLSRREALILAQDLLDGVCRADVAQRENLS